MTRAVIAATACLLVIEALALGARLARASAPYDDAFITFRYARNLAEGQGFVYNRGEHFGGTTSPAYALLLAGSSRLLGGADPVVVASWLSAFALALAAWCAFLLVLADFGLVAALIAGASVALNPILMSAWGGEWLIAVALMAAGLCAYRAGRVILAAVALSLAVLLRSEAALGVGIVAAHLLWTRRSRAAVPIGVIASVGLAWAVLSWTVTGALIPATLATKLAHGRSGLFGTLLGGFFEGARLFVRADPRMLAIAVLAWHGGLIAAVKRGVWWLLGLWIVAHVFFYTWLHLPFYHWYLVPIAFAISMATGIGVAAIRPYFDTLLRRPALARGAAAIAIVGLAGGGLLAEARSSRDWIRAKPDPRERAYNELGAWLAANTPPDASVAYLEIGRIGYLSRRRIVDLMGLVTPGVAERVANQDLLWAIYAYKPDYYVTSSMFTWAGSLAGEAWFESAYRPVKTTRPDGLDTVITVYRKEPGAVIPEPPILEAAELEHSGIIGEILPGVSHGQTFTATRDGLSGVAIQLATMARPNHGGMRLTVEDVASGRLVSDDAFDMADVVDNAWREFRFAPVAASRGRRYKLTIRAEQAAPGNAITVWYSRADRYPGGERLVNDSPAPGDLTLKLRYR